MKPISLDLMTQYHYLSDLKVSKDQSKLFFTETKADMERNDYCQRIQVIDTHTKEQTTWVEWRKRCTSFAVNDGLLLVEQDPEDLTTHTRFVWAEESNKQREAFKLPLDINTIQDFNNQYYLVSATINRRHFNYHHLTLEERLKEEEKKKADEDYLLFDEYPFYFNGAGIINGNRNSLFLVDKKTLEILDLIPPTIDVESFDVDGNEILYSGVDYTEVKGLWSNIWKVNALTLENELLYSEKMLIGRVFYYQHRIIVIGSYGTCIEGKNFYELKAGKMNLLFRNEGSLHNSVGSDCRYGKLKNFYKDSEHVYFMNTVDSRAPIFEFIGTSLEPVLDFEGSCDDLVVCDRGFYVIAMENQNLQEVFEVSHQQLHVLTHINTPLFENHYVAKPERLEFENQDKIVGWVLKPKDYDPTKTYPAILDIHGGPKTAYGEIFYHEMQVWASMGYFVMYCNPHCSDGRGNEFCNYMKHYGVTDYEDIMKFIDTVLELYPAIDSKRLGVTGGSYGGYMTNWIVTHTDRFKAAASQRSVSNRITQMIYSDYGIDTPFEFGVEDVNDCYELFWDRSPIKYINNATTPTLFLQSTNDWRCPMPEAIQMYTVMKCRGVETKLVGFKGENHELSRSGKPTHRLRRLQEITDWMEKHLK